MNEQGTFIATLLDHSGRAYASATALRIQEASDEGVELVQSFGFQALVGEIEGRVRVLAEALAAGCAELLVQDAQWLETMHSSRSVPPQLLRSILFHLEAELRENLPTGEGEMTSAYLLAAINHEAAPEASPARADSAPKECRDLSNHFLLAVLEGRASEAEGQISEALSNGTTTQHLHHFVLTPALRELGEMWHKGDISTAEEHLGSRIVERALAALRARMQKAPSKQKKVLLASVSGNLHDIGLRVVADQFELDGWTPIYLGANMPIADLATAVRDYSPDLVALSAGLGTQLRATAESINNVRAVSDEVPVLVGGGPFTTTPDLWKAVGADACASTAELAVEIGNKLTPS